ncbi:MAG: helix-turn-helix domain-containing protein, partial [Planctomycetia bacterium]
MTKTRHEDADFVIGSGNVFRDLGLDSPEEELTKAGLALQIHDRVKALGLNVTQAALRLGIPQPKASRLLRGYAEGFSTEKMLTFLTKLGQDVRVVVSDAAGKSPTGRFVITRVPATGAGRGRRRRAAVAARRRASGRLRW